MLEKSITAQDVINAEFQQLNTLSKKEREELGRSELLIPPHLTKFIVSDITQEGVAHVHEHNKRGICLYVDEQTRLSEQESQRLEKNSNGSKAEVKNE